MADKALFTFKQTVESADSDAAKRMGMAGIEAYSDGYAFTNAEGKGRLVAYSDGVAIDPDATVTTVRALWSAEPAVLIYPS